MPYRLTMNVKRVISLALLVAVVVSGIPRVQVHSHENAHIGHEHGAINSAGIQGDVSVPSELGQMDVDGAELHAHDLTPPSLTLAHAIQPMVTPHSPSQKPMSRPRTSPPQSIRERLYRPPIV